MRRFIPGLAVLAAMLGTGALVGSSLGARFWPVFLAVALGGFGLVAWLTHARWGTRPAPSARAGRQRKRGEVPPKYDLEADTSTDEQRWLI